MHDEPGSGHFWSGELTRVTDTRRVEHIGGPDDGDLLPVSANGQRPNGLYIVVNDGERCIAKQYVPTTI